MSRFPKALVKTARTLEQEEVQRLSALQQKRFVADGIDAIRRQLRKGHTCAPLCYCGKKKAKRRW